MSQDKIGITSEQSMRMKLDTGNMAEWLYNHFIELPKFLNGNHPDCCHLSSNLCGKHNQNCIKCLFENNRRNFENGNFDKDKLVSQIYEIANPANV